MFHGDLRADAHWYPLGYSLLGAPFLAASRLHPFFIADLVGLLVAVAAFARFARLFGVSWPLAMALFLLPWLESRVADVWIEPWNTTPEAALIWLLLALGGVMMTKPAPSSGRAVALGALAAGIATFRPTDIFIGIIVIATVIGHALRSRRCRWRDIGAGALGIAAIALPYAALHLAIYGPHLSTYAKNEAGLGFAPFDLPFRIFVLLEDPRAWFGEGSGLIQHLPWIIPGIAGMLAMPFLFRRAARWCAAMLALTLIGYYGLYLSYRGLLPPSLWRYGLIHYFVWTLPGLALFAWLWLRALFIGDPEHAGARRRGRLVPLAALAVTLLLLCPRLVPVPTETGTAARLEIFDATRIRWVDGYLNPSAIADARGTLENVIDMRVIPETTRARVIALRRPFTGEVRWVPGRAPPGAASGGAATRHYREEWRFGWPCALPPYSCGSLPVAP